MAFGMTLTGLSFLVLWYGATIGENMTKSADQLSAGEFRINERVLTNLGNAGVSKEVLDKIQNAKAPDGKNSVFGVKFASKILFHSSQICMKINYGDSAIIQR